VFAAPSVKLPGTRPVAAATPATEDRITGEELPIDGTGASSPTPFPSPTPESTDAAAVDPEPTTGAPAPSPAPSQGAEG
jgi:hypothetical protein